MSSNASLQTEKGLFRIKASDPPFTHVLAIDVTANAGEENERVVSLRCRKLDEGWETYTPGKDTEPVAVEMLLSFPEATFAKLKEGIGIALRQLAIAGVPKPATNADPTDSAYECSEDLAYRRRHYQHREHMPGR